MTGRDRFRAALRGADLVAFAPLTWARLPEFLHVARDDAFWLDVGITQRLLGDALSVCAADACVVPLLPRPRSRASGAGSPGGAAAPGDADPAGDAGDIAAWPEVTATTALLRRLADAGGPGLVAELPTLGDLSGLLPGGATEDVEDVEDALNDLARLGLEAGAQAVCVRGSPGRDVPATVEAIAPLADFYGARALGVDGTRGWAAGDSGRVGVFGRDGRWPELARGVVLTAGDLTQWWTPREVRARLHERREAG